MSTTLKNGTAKYRHELKYVISAAEVEIIKQRMKVLMKSDLHTGESGSYNIRSLYFDDYMNRCYYENENGTDPREKFRIRIYNESSERITLECKRKERGKTHKTSCPLTLEQTNFLMEGRPIPNISELPPLLRKLNVEVMTNGLRPVVIVDYTRFPYVNKNGNVRITLDTNISSSTDISQFLEKRIRRRPVMPTGWQLLEVKYDEYLPDYIFNTLQLSSLGQTAYSKYYICRKFII